MHQPGCLATVNNNHSARVTQVEHLHWSRLRSCRSFYCCLLWLIDDLVLVLGQRIQKKYASVDSRAVFCGVPSTSLVSLGNGFLGSLKDKLLAKPEGTRVFRRWHHLDTKIGQTHARYLTYFKIVYKNILGNRVTIKV